MRAVSANPHASAQPMAFAEAERSGRPFLVFHDRDGRRQVFVFESDQPTAAVGRLPTSDVVIDWDNQVSRTHARFEHGSEGWVVVDDGLSSNGTFVNEQRVASRLVLRGGDQIRFGGTIATFHAPKPPVPQAPPAPPAPPAAAPPPAAAQAPAPPAINLSSTQRRVLVALCRPYKDAQGFATPATDEAIAEELVLAAGEVRGHLRVLAAKLGGERRPDAERRVRLAQAAFAAHLVHERDP